MFMSDIWKDSSFKEINACNDAQYKLSSCEKSVCNDMQTAKHNMLNGQTNLKHNATNPITKVNKFFDFEQHSVGEKIVNSIKNQNNDSMRNKILNFSNKQKSMKQHDMLKIIQSSVSFNAQKIVKNILQQVDTFNDIERLFLYLKLPTGRAANFNPLLQNINPLGTRPSIQQTISWIQTHFTEDQDVCLLKNEVYREYDGIKPLSNADFGKVMRQVYPHVKPRRLGKRGKSCYCYSGLRKRAELDPPSLPSLFENTTKKEPHSADTQDAAILLVQEFCSHLLDHKFDSLNELAAYLIHNELVDQHSLAAITIMASRFVKDDFNNTEQCNNNSTNSQQLVQLLKKKCVRIKTISSENQTEDCFKDGSTKNSDKQIDDLNKDVCDNTMQLNSNQSLFTVTSMPSTVSLMPENLKNKKKIFPTTPQKCSDSSSSTNTFIILPSLSSTHKLKYKPIQPKPTSEYSVEELGMKRNANVFEWKESPPKGRRSVSLGNIQPISELKLNNSDFLNDLEESSGIITQHLNNDVRNAELKISDSHFLNNLEECSGAAAQHLDNHLSSGPIIQREILCNTSETSKQCLSEINQKKTSFYGDHSENLNVLPGISTFNINPICGSTSDSNNLDKSDTLESNALDFIDCLPDNAHFSIPTYGRMRHHSAQYPSTLSTRKVCSHRRVRTPSGNPLQSMHSTPLPALPPVLTQPPSACESLLHTLLQQPIDPRRRHVSCLSKLQNFSSDVMVNSYVARCQSVPVSQNLNPSSDIHERNDSDCFTSVDSFTTDELFSSNYQTPESSIAQSFPESPVPNTACEDFSDLNIDDLHTLEPIGNFPVTDALSQELSSGSYLTLQNFAISKEFLTSNALNSTSRSYPTTPIYTSNQKLIVGSRSYPTTPIVNPSSLSQVTLNALNAIESVTSSNSQQLLAASIKNEDLEMQYDVDSLEIYDF